MPDLLFEIGTEELPSWYVTSGRTALQEEVAKALQAQNIPFGEITSYGTPRRLAVLVRGIATHNERRQLKKRGPARAAAVGPDGEFTKAAIGFARGAGVEPGQLVIEETEKGEYLFALLETGGEPVERLLPALLGEVVATLPAPRKMRWANVETPFVRPISWLLAMLDGEVLEVEAAGLQAGNSTRGHRFLAPGRTELSGPEEYVQKLEEAWVLAGEEERRELTRRQVTEAARELGYRVYESEGLLAEVANLVEYPFPIVGRFDEGYLELPAEVLSTVMIHHQRFFPLLDGDGGLSNAFVAVSNNRVPDESVVRSGYEKVLAGRLYDASFFWRSDRNKSLSQHAWALSGIQFHKELGTMADKVARVDGIARELAQLAGAGKDDLEVLERALPVFRADLGTEMVFEFPELEGVMARAYAIKEGFPQAVGVALEEGVRPKAPGDGLPASMAGAVLSASDRVDKLVGFYSVGGRVTGSADPFGLRRDALGLVRILNSQGWQVTPRQLLELSANAYGTAGIEIGEDVLESVERYIWDRVASLLAEEGVGVHMVRAACGDGPPVITAARRAHLLVDLSQEEEFAQLLALYKRAANLGAHAPEDAAIDTDLFRDPHEAPLNRALHLAREGMDQLLRVAKDALSPWDLGKGPGQELPDLDEEIERVLQLKGPLDAFLDNVLVMVDDEALRRNRLVLLREVRDALRALGTLEQLEGLNT